MTTTSLPPPVASAARALRSSMGGTVLVSADSSYDAARRLWNGAIDRRPALIARCADDRDVATAVRVAREYGLPLSVRGGGHDWNGQAVREGGLMIDLSALRRVTVYPDSEAAAAQGGSRARDLVAATHQHGLTPATGTINAVGMAGLTLAGGYGLLNGRAGLALDNLTGADVVLADGRQVTANDTENPDLYWALRGGGGNFGVVTTMHYRVHPIRSLVSGLMLFPLTEAITVLRGYRELLADAPDELTVMAGFFGGPDGRPLFFLLPAWAGEAPAGERFVSRLQSLGKPVSADLAPMTYPDILGLFDSAIVNGRHYAMETRWLPELTEDTAAMVVDAMARVTSPFSALFLHHFHGVASRVGSDATAFALRRDHVLVEVAAGWEPQGPADDGRHRAWARALSDNLAPYSLPGGYTNLLGVDEYDRAALAYGPNLDRLLRLKAKFDPDGVLNALPALGPRF